VVKAARGTFSCMFIVFESMAIIPREPEKISLANQAEIKYDFIESAVENGTVSLFLKSV
jgi:hypothetical protein